MPWAKPVLIGVAGACAVLLAIEAAAGRYRAVVVAVAMAALLAAPSAWAVADARPRHQQHVPGRRARRAPSIGGPAVAAVRAAAVRAVASRRARRWRRRGSAAARRPRRAGGSASGSAGAPGVSQLFQNSGRAAPLRWRAVASAAAAGLPAAAAGVRRRQRVADSGRSSTPRPWRRRDRGLEPEHGGRGHPRRLHERRRPRRVLRARELGDRQLDRDGGPRGSPALGDRRRHARAAASPGDTRTGSQAAMNVVAKTCRAGHVK